MHRAYSILTNKALSEDADFVYVEGIASTPEVDRVGDVVEPMGARFVTPMPLLSKHNHDKPVGHMTFAKPTRKGIPFKAQLPRVREPGLLKDRVDEAIHELQYGLVSAVSIGFKAVADKVERMASGGIRFLEWDWLELSLVTIPANSGAVITAIKSIDREHLPSAGHGVSADNPGAPKASTPKAAPRGAVKLIPRKHS